MGSWHGCSALLAGLVVAGLAGCGESAPGSPAPTQVATTPSTGTDLSELLKVYADFGTAGGLFWEVAGVHVVGVTAVDATHADVALSGPVVWCLGTTPG
jgi:hypothetical protein